FLRENPDLRVEIENKVRAALGVPLLPVDETAQGKSGKAVKADKAAKVDKATGKSEPVTPAAE
ncbi:MAG: recombinase RecA, partial [Hydrogenophaga sp.]|nr:recombinase RecA [Hydrogenophaga sp.]